MDALDTAVRSSSVSRTAEVLSQDDTHTNDLRHDAVATGASVEMLELLTRHKYDPDRAGLHNTGEQGRRLIDYSTVLGRDDVVRWLVDRGVSLTHGEEGDDLNVIPMPQPLLEVAAQYASLSTFKLLLKNGAKLGRRTLHCASLFAAAIKADPSVSLTKDWIGFRPDKKWGPERKRMSEILPYLVDDLGSDVNAIDIKRREGEPPGFYGTPLCYAVYNDGVAVVKWLLSKGADPHETADPSSRVNAVNLGQALGAEKSLKAMEEWKTSKAGP